MAKRKPREKLKPAHIKMSETMLRQLDEESVRTGNSRSALIRDAWAEYVRLRQPPKNRAP